MPQMAPSLWLIVYVCVSLMVIFFGKILFFSPHSKVSFSKQAYVNKSKDLMWQ
uniref:ATP synthase complex subunit 8 n=1 Tax=Metacrangonyx sp. 5 MDMBR-2012 TaxID=1200664 RepID=K7ZVQ0_9CRUS|nr:ATP synthase F0 subunit 8 [Metacrangonyx sp. 5 MDMBR-2012]